MDSSALRVLTTPDLRPAVVEPLTSVSRVTKPRRAPRRTRPIGRCQPQRRRYCARACGILPALPPYRGRENGLLCVFSFTFPSLNLTGLDEQEARKVRG